jgi:hypothetical protein
MSKWTHPICQRCWAKGHPGTTPVKVREWHWERCCYCGKNTRGGIFIRQDPKHVPLCEGHQENETTDL